MERGRGFNWPYCLESVGLEKGDSAIYYCRVFFCVLSTVALAGMREYSTCMCTWSESEGESGVLFQLHFARCSTAVIHNHIVDYDISRACSGHVCVHV